MTKPQRSSFDRDSPASPDPEPPSIPIEPPDLFDEDWLAVWRERIVNCYRQLMTRLVTTYFGVWPRNCYEYLQYRNMVTQFHKTQNSARTRITLQGILAQNYTERGVRDLNEMNAILIDQFDKFRFKYELFISFMQMETQKNPEVTRYIYDLRTHSEAYKIAARSELICNIQLYLDKPLEAFPRDVLAYLPPDVPKNVLEDKAALSDVEAVGKKDDHCADEDRKVGGEKNDDNGDDKMVSGKNDGGENDKVVGEKGDNAGKDGKKASKQYGDDDSDGWC